MPYGLYPWGAQQYGRRLSEQDLPGATCSGIQVRSAGAVVDVAAAGAVVDVAAAGTVVAAAAAGAVVEAHSATVTVEVAEC